jgi:hypothetical protein
MREVIIIITIILIIIYITMVGFSLGFFLFSLEKATWVMILGTCGKM